MGIAFLVPGAANSTNLAVSSLAAGMWELAQRASPGQLLTLLSFRANGIEAIAYAQLATVMGGFGSEPIAIVGFEDVSTIMRRLLRTTPDQLMGQPFTSWGRPSSWATARARLARLARRARGAREAREACEAREAREIRNQGATG